MSPRTASLLSANERAIRANGVSTLTVGTERTSAEATEPTAARVSGAATLMSGAPSHGLGDHPLASPSRTRGSSTE